MKQVAINIANSCEHVRISNSVEDYIDPRIIYSFLLENDMVDMDHLFFTPQLKELHAWAHPNNYSYLSFNRYKVLTILFN